MAGAFGASLFAASSARVHHLPIQLDALLQALNT
jgi:hypothetical protein